MLAILSSILLVGCSESESKPEKEIIGIIGAMDVEAIGFQKGEIPYTS